jgi:hypothetical protein
MLKMGKLEKEEFVSDKGIANRARYLCTSEAH